MISLELNNNIFLNFSTTIFQSTSFVPLNGSLKQLVLFFSVLFSG